MNREVIDFSIFFVHMDSSYVLNFLKTILQKKFGMVL